MSCNFNPRSHEGSDKYIRNPFLCFTYFNPRSHEGSDYGGAHRKRAFGISIHAPTRGATIAEAIIDLAVLFQSTLPRGERRQQWSNSSVRICISIHAPTRGATCLRRGTARLSENFNPRSHEGSDSCQTTATTRLILFQSTLPRGERRCVINRLYRQQCTISIHAPTRGATLSHTLLPDQYNISIHAPTRGATQFKSGCDNLHNISIHAPTRGATL